jgi:hypothetical protein
MRPSVNGTRQAIIWPTEGWEPPAEPREPGGKLPKRKTPLPRCMGHVWSEEAMVCEGCGTPWEDHRREPQLCQTPVRKKGVGAAACAAQTSQEER